jgi:hypothetical protein
MFSVSSPTSSRAEALAALEAALALVAEDSFFAFVEPVEEGWRDVWSAGHEWLEATVTFHGGAEGIVVCRLPQSLAQTLAAAFLGLSEEDLATNGAAVHDMSGELANMVCGCWLTRAFPSKLFELDPPVITPSEIPPADWFVKTVNGAPLGLLVSIGEG